MSVPDREAVRDDIEDALDYYDGDESMMPPAFQGLLDVARLWLASPTDEQVEAAALWVSRISPRSIGGAVMWSLVDALSVEDDQ